jgi:hypothetical protein
MPKEDKCHFCNRLATTEKEIVVDIEAEHDIDPATGQEVWYSKPIYEIVGVCQEHLETEERRD